MYVLAQYFQFVVNINPQVLLRISQHLQARNSQRDFNFENSLAYW